MTVETLDITSGPYIGNGALADYSYDFRVNDKTQLSVFETDLDGVITELTVDTDYTVAGIGNDVGGILTRVAGNLPTDYEWYIRSNYVSTQETAFASQGGFFPEVHESAMDKLTFLIQQIEDVLGRSVRLSGEIDNDGSFLIEADETGRANTAVTFDGAGDLILLGIVQEGLVPVVFALSTILSDGQTVVSFTSSIENASFYVSGDLADNGRLVVATDYTADLVANEITLTQSYPAGTTVTLVYNTQGVTVSALVTSGTGTPEGNVTAGVGTLYLRTDGGASTTLYVKESGVGNTGWIAK